MENVIYTELLRRGYSVDVGKEAQETFSLRNSGDFFRKLVIAGGSQPLRANEDGIYFVGVIPFLLDPAILLGE